MSASSTPLTAFDQDIEFYATCGAGLDALLSTELKTLELARVQSAGAGVRFFGRLVDGYKACLWSRVANRVLLPIHRGPAPTPEALYDLVQEIDWQDHLDVDGSLAVDFFTANSEITHSQYGALKVKDAVVDQFRVRLGRRPDVDRQTPDVRINVYLFRNQARIAIDLSGSSLHRRGYRHSAGLAPLKENLAAAILLAGDWPNAMNQGRALFDPLCGSATLLIEAAMIATNTAPGLLREYFGFQGWTHHDADAWQTLVDDAKSGVCESGVLIGGADQDETAVRHAQQNIDAAGFGHVVTLSHQSLRSAPPPIFSQQPTGFIATNPPYGERLATDARFYADMGAELSRHFSGWTCSLFTATAAPCNRMRLPLTSLLKTRNGGIDCVLLHGQIPTVSGSGDRSNSSEISSESSNTDVASEASSLAHPQAALYRGKQGQDQQSASQAPGRVSSHVDATPFVNRIRKNQKGLKGWLKQNRINAYRLYDADLPEFAVAVDVFHGAFDGKPQTHCVVQEYEAPATVNLAVAEQRLNAIMAALPAALDIKPDQLHLKVRQKKSGSEQYEKLAPAGSVILMVEESGAELELNLTDYLDTGLFLDHRAVRRFIQQNAAGKRFLNLFAYTATATVAAVFGKASSSVSVDSSNRYCQWAKRNLDNNAAAAQLHEVVRQDVFDWLAAAQPGLSDDRLFDLVLLDPPTFSNSSDQDRDWNVQRDHVEAIDACLSVMAPGGLLIFSNNYRRFKLDPGLLDPDLFDPHLLKNANQGVSVEDRSRWSIDRDFHRNQRIHQCWFIYKT